MSELLRELDEMPLSLLEMPADALHDVLGGPTLFHLQGGREPALFVCVLMHGNETSGWDAIRQVLHDCVDRDGLRLPRSLSLFVGNTAAAQKGVRHLPDQPDYNRVWPGSETHGTPEHELMKSVMDRMGDREIFASIDLHNNTGLNPHYACVNVLEHQSLHLASLFGRTVVYFVRPRGVASMAMAALGPSVTLECGKVGQKHGVAHAADYLRACLHLSEIPAHAVPSHDIDLYHTVAVVRVPPGQPFDFGDRGSAISFPRDLDRMNFRELAVGSLIAECPAQLDQPLDVRDEQDRQVAQDYFVLEEGRLITRVPVMPSMLSCNPEVIRQDCLCYLMERYNDHLAEVISTPPDSMLPPIIIDIEASGFGRGSYPLEVGVVMTDGTRHCFLIAPARAWTHWDEKAEMMHGISRALLLKNGRPLQDVAWRLNELLRGKTVYSDAWSFDMSWVGKLFDAADMQQTFRVAALAELLDEQQLARWDGVKQRVAGEMGLRRHRASGDARILQETWRRLSLQPA